MMDNFFFFFYCRITSVDHSSVKSGSLHLLKDTSACAKQRNDEGKMQNAAPGSISP